MENNAEQKFKSGFAVMAGLANAGKSTLLNQFAGVALSPVTHKPQTTRQNILAICEGDDYQIVFVDTPGLHDPVKYRSNITREYIAHANAVLVAVKLGALTEEPLETITTVLDYAGNNRDKVFIVGTQ